MNPSDLRPDASDSPLDARLREAFDFLNAPPGAVPSPPPGLWAGVEVGLRPAAVPAHRWRAVGVPVLTGVLGLLVMAGLDRLPTERTATRGGTVANPVACVTPSAARVTSSTARVTPSAARVIASAARVTLPVSRIILPATRVVPPGSRVIRAVARVTLPTARIIPPTGRVTRAVDGVTRAAESVTLPATLLPLAQAETALTALGADTTRAIRESRRAALLIERAVLAALTRRTDSLLLTLGVLPEVSPALAAADSLSPSYPPTPPPFKKWSVAATFAPERNFFGLQSPEADTLSALRRTHEQGRAGFNAAVGVEYRFNQRWSVGAGLGVSSYGAELRLTDRRTDVTVAYDTQTSHSTQQTQVSWNTYSIRIVQDPVLSPVFNINQQIIGYDTVFVPRPDTVWTHVISNSTNVQDSVITTPTVTTRQETSARILRPNYRFLTVPLLVRYRLGAEGGTFGGPGASRWWADMALGAQVQFFLGGTQLASTDGRAWRTERVGPGGGPFRPLTVALTGAVALNYALTPHLSASLAPTLRYQTESIYKASTGLTQRPAATGVMMGLKLAF